jgi:acyl-[acyl carrier protein]--UDP-N-acetylglucosamine O-acyltransferase
MIVNLKDEDQHKHRNGGGYVANTAHVDDSVYVGPHAIVYGKAECTGRVRVEDFAQISGDAKLSGDTVVSHFAWVSHGTHKTGHIFKNEREHKEQKRLRPAEDGL